MFCYDAFSAVSVELSNEVSLLFCFMGDLFFCYTEAKKKEISIFVSQVGPWSLHKMMMGVPTWKAGTTRLAMRLEAFYGTIYY
jgi:hypothetical protein